MMARDWNRYRRFQHLALLAIQAEPVDDPDKDDAKSQNELEGGGGVAISIDGQEGVCPRVARTPWRGVSASLKGKKAFCAHGAHVLCWPLK
jgi:hypothetical protein